MKLLFIRHAQSVGNQAQRMVGQGEDELSNLGYQQAKLLAQRLRSEAWWPSHIYSSPAQRSRQTVEILLAQFFDPPLPPQDKLQSEDAAVFESGAINLSPMPDVMSPRLRFVPDLHEYQNGIFQGLTWPEAQQRYPDLCAALEVSQDWIPIPGAETLQQGHDRAQQFIQRLLDQHTHQDQIWIITHHWILQHLVSELLGCDRAWGFSAHNTALFEFWLDRDRWHRRDHSRLNTELWQIRRFNDIQHLAPRC